VWKEGVLQVTVFKETINLQLHVNCNESHELSVQGNNSGEIFNLIKL
jgi:hypothetical protein